MCSVFGASLLLRRISHGDQFDATALSVPHAARIDRSIQNTSPESPPSCCMPIKNEPRTLERIGHDLSWQIHLSFSPSPEAVRETMDELGRNVEIEGVSA